MSRNLWLTLAVLLFTAGLGLHWIFQSNTDLPPGGQATYRAEFETATKRGQAPYDARLLATESLAFELVSLAIALGLVARELTPTKFAVLTAATLGCLVLSPLAPRPLPITSGLAALTRSLSPDDPAQDLSFWPCLATLLPWGYAGVAWLLIVSVPAAMLSLSTVEEDGGRFDPNRILSFLALMAVVGLLVLAAFSVTPAAGRELWFAAALLNAAILIAKPLKPIWSTLWFLAVLIPILDPSGEPVPLQTGPAQDSAITADLRHKVATGELFSDPKIRRVLPESIRPPIEVERVVPNTSIDAEVARVVPNALGDADRGQTSSALGTTRATFEPGAAPTLPGEDDRPLWGNWSRTGPPNPTGEFTSTIFHSTTGIIQLRVAGTLSAPSTDLTLKSGDGRIYHPLITKVAALNRWRRLNFEVRPGPYQLIATVHSPAAWLAFTAPEEIYPSARFAGKLVQTWVYWIVAAALVALGVAAVAYRAAVKTAQAEGSLAPYTAPLALFSPTIPPILIRAAPWLALVAYALLLSHHIDTTAGPNDSGGYLNSAKLLAAHHTAAWPRIPLPGQQPTGPTDLSPYLPGTFVATPDGRLAPTYPVGFPLLIAAVAQAIPLHAAVPIVILVQICLGVVLTFLLARQFDLSVGWASFAAALVGLSPIYLFQALQPQSDGPALVWVTGAIYFAWTSAKHPWHALLAGAATAVAILIRPSNTLALVPLAICLWGLRRQLLFWVIGGIPGAIFQFWYDRRLYGSGFSTGYGNAGDVSSGFGLRFAPLTWHAYLHWLPAFLSPLIMLSLAGPWLPHHPRRARLMLAAWAAVFLLFYTFYWCTYDNWYNMRFVLPAAPALIVLALWSARWLCELWPVPLLLRWGAALVLLALLIERSATERVFYWMHANRVNADAAEWARDHLPSNAVVVGKHITGPLFYYSDLAILRTDSKPAQSPAFYAELAQAGRPVYALTFHWERPGYHWGAGKGDGYPDAPGNWQHLASIGDGEVHAWIRK